MTPHATVSDGEQSAIFRGDECRDSKAGITTLASGEDWSESKFCSVGAVNTSGGHKEYATV